MTASKDFVVLDKETHFRHNPQNNEVMCTHGGWGGKFKINEDGSCEVILLGGEVIKYDSCKFTSLESYDDAYATGLITR